MPIGESSVSHDQDEVLAAFDTETADSCEWQQPENFCSVDSLMDNRWDKAKFLLRVTEEHNLTHHGVDSICDSVQWLVDSIIFELKNKIKAEIPEDVNAEGKSNILDACNPGDIFFGLKTRYLREKYYENYFKYVVSINV